PMSEKVFQGAVIALAERNAWKVYHTYDSRKSEAGFPDLTMARGRRVVFAELKSEDGRLTAPQLTWGELLAGVGGTVEYYCWRPSDWSEIVRTLSAAP